MKTLAILYFFFQLTNSLSTEELPPSSVRRSLNWVLPSYQSSPNTYDLNSQQLINFNQDFQQRFSSVQQFASQNEVSSEDLIKTVAQLFLSQLHPDKLFKLTSAYLSSHNGIGHAHFVQLVRNDEADNVVEKFLEVSNADISVNIDLKDGRILNVFDNSWTPSEFDLANGREVKPSIACDHIFKYIKEELERSQVHLDENVSLEEHFKKKRDQTVFSPSSDSSSPIPPDLMWIVQQADCIAPFEAPYLPPTPSSPLTDPRLSLLSFLSVAHPSFVENSLLTNGLGLDTFSVVYNVEKGEFEIDYDHEVNTFAPSGNDDSKEREGNFFEQPISAKLAYLAQPSGSLTKTWKLSIPSNLNWYEAYVSASNPFSEEDGNVPVKMVVDYVKDFRPTGGEIVDPKEAGEMVWMSDLSEVWKIMAEEKIAEFEEFGRKLEEGAKKFGHKGLPEDRRRVTGWSMGMAPLKIGVWKEIVKTEDLQERDGDIEKRECHHDGEATDLAMKKMRKGKAFADKESKHSHLSYLSKPTDDAELPVFPDIGPIYRVFPWSVNDPTVDSRRTLLKHQVDAKSSKKTTDLDWEASPVGWHRIPGVAHGGGWENDEDWLNRVVKGEEARFTDTRGNNVFAQANPSGGFTFAINYRPSGIPTSSHGHNYSSDVPLNSSYPVVHPIHELNFTFPLGFSYQKNATCGLPGCEAPEPKDYLDASVTELFYTNNEIHDLFYRYGFDEVSGNFQENNFEKGGLGGDAVQANAQDGSGTNNANFATPPDGQRGRMRMYVWTTSDPNRDGDLEAGIVIHEYAHGISNRLTGGPANSACLGWGEAGGMGEGWGDALATLIRMHGDGDMTNLTFGMGDWASGREGGIRKYRYSRDMTVNPETYKVLDGFAYFGVHAIGEVWAEMLFEIGENLIAKHGFSKSLFPPVAKTSLSDLKEGKELTDDEKEFWFVNEKTGLKVPKHGNTLMVQLIIDGMKLQPCRPTFISARNAILQADEILTGGENACEIWKGFSKRGLGPDASLIGATPWGGGRREEDYVIPTRACKA